MFRLESPWMMLVKVIINGLNCLNSEEVTNSGKGGRLNTQEGERCPEGRMSWIDMVNGGQAMCCHLLFLIT